MKRVVIGLFLLIATHSRAQEMWGVAVSNYAGQMGVALNPATIVNAPYKWEAHLISFDAALYNNYYFLKANSKLIRNGVKGEAVNQDRFSDLYTRSNKNAYSSGFLKYPAFIYSGKKYAFAFSASTRAELSAVRVPYHLAKFMLEGFNYGPQQQIDYSGGNAKMAFINWHELAFTAGTTIYNGEDYTVRAAATLKYNYGLNALYANIDQIDYTVQSDSVLVIRDLDASYGHAMPDNGNDGFSKSIKRRGTGWSGDAGIIIYKNYFDNFYNPCITRKTGKPYDYRLGISLIDLGYIHYSKDAKTFLFSDVKRVWRGIDTVQFNGIGRTDTILGNHLSGGPNNARDKFSFTVQTPTALSVQMDVPLSARFYINMAIMQRIPYMRVSIRRANMIAFSARYETRHFEIDLPVSLYDYQNPRLGFSMRYGAFTIGTDILGTFAGLTNNYGADLYFGLSVKNFGGCARNEIKKARLEKCNTPK